MVRCSTLGQAGANQQAQEQAILDQQREANRMAAYEPYERLGYMGAGMGNVMGGAMGQYQPVVTPNKSPISDINAALVGLWNDKIMFNKTLHRPMFRKGGSTEVLDRYYVWLQAPRQQFKVQVNS